MRLLFFLPWLLLTPLALPVAAFDQLSTLAQAETTAPDRPVLGPGSEGNAVIEVQALLILLGFYQGAVDGQYSDDTATAVAQFQQRAGLTADGIVGPDTWDQLLPSATADAVPPQGAVVPAAEADPSTSPPSSTVNSTDDDLSDETEAEVSPGAEVSDNQSPNLGAELGPDPSNAAPAPTASPEAEAEPAAETVPVELPILRVGMEGPAVVRLQQRLRTLGTYSGSLDGVFGPETERGVIQVQRNAGIEADGIVGPVTWGVLLR